MKKLKDLGRPKVHNFKPRMCCSAVTSAFHFNLSGLDRQPRTHYAD